MSEKKIPVSVLIIAQNAQKFLKRCLDTLVEFDEVVFVDGGSTDKTVALAQAYPNVKVFHNPWPGFIAQRNFSVAQASHPWSFMIDIDEAATPELVEAIKEIITRESPRKMYRVVRTEYLEGEAIEIGLGGSTYQERIFQTKHVQYGGGVHHKHYIDGVETRMDDPQIENLPPEIRVLHNPDYSLDEMIQKLPRFSILIANEKFKEGRRTSALEVFVTFPGVFFKTYRKSWRAGNMGFVNCIMEALHCTIWKLYIYHIQKARSAKMNDEFEKSRLG